MLKPRGNEDTYNLEGQSRLERDPEFRIRLLKWFWLVGLATMLFGYAVMALLLLGYNPWG